MPSVGFEPDTGIRDQRFNQLAIRAFSISKWLLLVVMPDGF